jgi:hypothetical protein
MIPVSAGTGMFNTWQEYEADIARDFRLDRLYPIISDTAVTVSAWPIGWIGEFQCSGPVKMGRRRRRPVQTAVQMIQ